MEKVMVIVIDSPNMKRLMLDNGDTITLTLHHGVWKLFKSFAGMPVETNKYDLAIMQRNFDLGGYSIVED